MLFGFIWKLSFPVPLLQVRWIVFRGSLYTNSEQPERLTGDLSQ